MRPVQIIVTTVGDEEGEGVDPAAAVERCSDRIEDLERQLEEQDALLQQLQQQQQQQNPESPEERDGKGGWFDKCQDLQQVVKKAFN